MSLFISLNHLCNSISSNLCLIMLIIPTSEKMYVSLPPRGLGVVPGGGGGGVDSHIEQTTGMLLGNFKFNP